MCVHGNIFIGAKKWGGGLQLKGVPCLAVKAELTKSSLSTQNETKTSNCVELTPTWSVKI